VPPPVPSALRRSPQPNAGEVGPAASSTVQQGFRRGVRQGETRPGVPSANVARRAGALREARSAGCLRAGRTDGSPLPRRTSRPLERAAAKTGRGASRRLQARSTCRLLPRLRARTQLSVGAGRRAPSGNGGGEARRSRTEAARQGPVRLQRAWSRCDRVLNLRGTRNPIRVGRRCESVRELCRGRLERQPPTGTRHQGRRRHRPARQGHADPGRRRSGWLVESLATQSLAIFAIRTRRVPFFRSRPSTSHHSRSLLRPLTVPAARRTIARPRAYVPALSPGSSHAISTTGARRR
jgi:hypothetical protein